MARRAPLALLLALVERAAGMCNGEDGRCFGQDRSSCEALEAQFICCFWDDGSDQSGYCEGTHSDCSKCAPTKGDCDILSQCEWVDTTPQCLSTEGEVTATCSSANSKGTCESNSCCWTARCSCANVMPDSRCATQYSQSSCELISACAWVGDCNTVGYVGDGPFCPAGPPAPPPALNCVYIYDVNGDGYPDYTCASATR